MCLYIFTPPSHLPFYNIFTWLWTVFTSRLGWQQVMVPVLLLVPVDTSLVWSFQSPCVMWNLNDASRKSFLSTLCSASIWWLLHKPEMNCSLLMPPAFENPNLIALNCFVPPFHVELHIYIRGKKLIFTVLLYHSPIYVPMLQLLVCALIDSSASLLEFLGKNSLIASTLLCCVSLRSAAMCTSGDYDVCVSVFFFW